MKKKILITILTLIGACSSVYISAGDALEWETAEIKPVTPFWPTLFGIGTGAVVGGATLGLGRKMFNPSMHTAVGITAGIAALSTGYAAGQMRYRLIEQVNSNFSRYNSFVEAVNKSCNEKGNKNTQSDFFFYPDKNKSIFKDEFWTPDCHVLVHKQNETSVTFPFLSQKQNNNLNQKTYWKYTLGCWLLFGPTQFNIFNEEEKKLEVVYKAIENLPTEIGEDCPIQVYLDPNTRKFTINPPQQN